MVCAPLWLRIPSNDDFTETNRQFPICDNWSDESCSTSYCIKNIDINNNHQHHRKNTYNWTRAIEKESEKEQKTKKKKKCCVASPSIWTIRLIIFFHFLFLNRKKCEQYLCKFNDSILYVFYLSFVSFFCCCCCYTDVCVCVHAQVSEWVLGLHVSYTELSVNCEFHF